MRILRPYLHKITAMGLPTMPTMPTVKRLTLYLFLIMVGFFLGVTFNYYGLLFESIKVEVQLSPAEMHMVNKSLRHLSSVEVNALDPLAPQRQAQPHDEYVVPNIVHFIWFGADKKMSFVNYISIRSAQKIQKPDKIYLHCNNLPVGPWWERLRKEVNLTIVHRNPPETIHGQPLLHMYHKGDVAKMEILMEYGGIYLDYDVFVVRSMDPIRKYDLTLGKEKKDKFIAGIIVARKDSPFLKMWYNSYKQNYRPFDWDYNCARVTYQLYLQFPSLLHVEPRGFTTPDWLDRHLLWNEVIDWSELYCIHIMLHLSWAEYTPENIKGLKSTFGEVARYIYYGNKEIIP